MMGKKVRHYDKFIDVDMRAARGIFLDFQIGLGKAVLQSDKGNLEALSILGRALTRSGRHDEALEVDRRIAELSADDPTAHYNLACSYSNLSRLDRAIESLERALKLGYADISHLLRDEDLRNVRRDPRFRKLIEKKWGRRQSRR